MGWLNRLILQLTEKVESKRFERDGDDEVLPIVIDDSSEGKSAHITEATGIASTSTLKASLSAGSAGPRNELKLSENNGSPNPQKFKRGFILYVVLEILNGVRFIK
jgi:hypothetical protein